MTTSILLIENNLNTVERIKTFLSELDIEDYTISLGHSHALKIIDSMNFDLIICNPSVFEQENLTSYLKKKSQLSIPVLWIMPENDTALTKILLKYTPN